MGFIARSDFDFNSSYLGKITIKHGACFRFMDCIIKFDHLDFPEILIYSLEQNEKSANEKITFTANVLSFLFAQPINIDYVSLNNNYQYILNDIISTEKKYRFNYIENKINKFNNMKSFFRDMMKMVTISYNNLYNDRDEDAFLYFFKIIENVAKKYYLLYLEFHYTKNRKKGEKLLIKKFLSSFLMNNLLVRVTDNISNTLVDELHKQITNKTYGSIFGKISFFITKNKVKIDINRLYEIIDLRNRIAHGDIISEDTLSHNILYCEFIMLQMLSIFFFRKDYKKINIKSYRYIMGESII